ncbi:hypothetical protein [Caldalkalibacillus salinus]|uniref:hypothetical protein n=1 Tax=Caldalkalibacillus salinus TaxID=2803787 RepID=UPI001923680D|nr:hypothetical protein [Caldalkalibacillus salinus]
MRTFMFVIFVLLITYLVFTFITDVLRKKLKKNTTQADIHGIIIPAIVASLVAHGLISKTESEELDGATFEELEEYLVTHDVFASRVDIKDWIFDQPELVAQDGLFDGIDALD